MNNWLINISVRAVVKVTTTTKVLCEKKIVLNKAAET
jgi:hypothetical protein